MASLLQGLAGALNTMFGAPVTVLPLAGGSVTVVGVFRREPVMVQDGEGASVIVSAPTLRLQRSVRALDRGDLVEPSEASGETFRVVNSFPSGSNATDAFVVYELEVTA